MFAELKQRILKSTAERKYPFPRSVSRTFFFLVSPAMSGIKDWLEEFFPVPTELTQLHPWFLMQDGDNFRINVEESVKSAFDVKGMEEITSQGFSILDSLNQVIVIADLSEVNIYEKIVNGCKIIRDSIHKIIDPRTPVLWIAIFALRRPEYRESTKDGTAEMRSTNPDILKPISQEPLQSLFHRIFLLDISNPQGALISDPKDQYCLIGHLLYFLIASPSLAESSDRYTDWLVKTADEGCISGFSAFSLILPVDQILETVALFKGAEVMKESLLTEGSINYYSFYLNSFLQENSLVEPEEVRRTISEDPHLPLKDPLLSFPDFFKMRPEDYVETMNTLDAFLPNAAKGNEEIMGKTREKRIKEWKESLDDHLEAMITRETGGLLVAKKFLQELLNHLEKLASEQVPTPQYDDPSPCISVIQRLVQHGPRKEGIYGRAVVLALISDVGVSSFVFEPWMKILLLIGLPIFVLALAMFVSYSNRQELENQILKLERLLRGKWRILIETAKGKVAKKLIEDFLKTVKQFTKEVDGALGRVNELVNYFQNEYRPSFPEEFAFRKFVVKERNELLQHTSLCKANLSRLAVDYIEGDRPLYLWRRLSSPGTSQPIEWEQHIMEMAAIRLLPDCGDIVNLHIFSFLQPGQEKFERYKMAIVRGIQPFLTLRPGSPSPELNAILDTEPKEAQPVVGKLMSDLSGYFHNIQQIGIRSPYRLSVFGFLDGAKIDEILLR